MSIAQRVKDASQGAAATTFEGGYSVQYNGARVFFPTGKLLKERRNDKGRCTLALYEYEDGSRLEFTYRNETARFRVLLPRTH
jgi:hypothetical protein